MNSTTPQPNLSRPLKVGIIGTGYAAQRRAETLIKDERSQLCYVSGHTRENVANFCQTYNISACDSWEALVNHPELDLVVICNINRDHGAIARQAIQSGKHVIVEYPLSLNFSEATEIVALATENNLLLHIEHIEILGGLHQTVLEYRSQLGDVFYGRYTTINGVHPVTRRWSFNREMFGFPFMAALPRIHRFTDLFGEVETVFCQSRFWDVPNSDYFTAFLSNANLGFKNGLKVDLVYGKGDRFWKNDRTFELYGDRGTLIFQGDQGKLMTQQGEKTLELPPRRGLFAKDTAMVLDYLFEGKPLYIDPQSSLYALKIGDAANQSNQSGQIINL
ncbi:MAG TPA: glycosyl transferase family 2 [Cyanothece sp. UBA12306]|nr:glycosyl transferase family 2 [Cyanothece sp. UBA12306]